MQRLGQNHQFVLLGNRLTPQPARHRLEAHGATPVARVEQVQQHRRTRLQASRRHRVSQALGEFELVVHARTLKLSASCNHSFVVLFVSVLVSLQGSSLLRSVHKPLRKKLSPNAQRSTEANRDGIVFIAIRTLLTGALVVATLTACGGGDSTDETYEYVPVDTYGAIAISRSNGAGGIATSYQSQSRANDAAKSRCGNTCTVELEFYGSGICGAISRSSSGAIGWATNYIKSTAKNSANQACQSAGGLDCAIILEGCNE